MAEDFKLVLFLSIPVIISGVLHMAAVSFGFLNMLAIPIKKEMFGRNKTWRGVLLVPIFTVVGVYSVYFLQDAFSIHLFKSHSQMILVGTLLGLAYLIGELPNSYWKRKKGISEGKTPNSTGEKILHVIVDQTDSVLICCFVYYTFFMEVSLYIVFLTTLTGMFLHIGINILLYIFKLRKEPF